jgi:hypothetical protein
MVGLNVCIDTTTIKELYYVGFLFVDLFFDFFILHSFYCNSSKIFQLGEFIVCWVCLRCLACCSEPKNSFCSGLSCEVDNFVYYLNFVIIGWVLPSVQHSGDVVYYLLMMHVEGVLFVYGEIIVIFTVFSLFLCLILICIIVRFYRNFAF